MSRVSGIVAFVKGANPPVPSVPLHGNGEVAPILQLLETESRVELGVLLTSIVLPGQQTSSCPHGLPLLLGSNTALTGETNKFSGFQRFSCLNEDAGMSQTTSW